MKNLTITFTYPWLLLLLIPAIGIAFIPYFRMKKKYRRQRNRVTSIVLHTIIIFCCVFVLAGMHFDYRIPNENNEVIFLVDMSETEEQSQEQRDDFLQTAINIGKYDEFKMGVVTFGFDQVYAVPLTNDADKIYDTYALSESPDTSATDIAAALNYTKTLFTDQQSGKIVLITDGKETDESAKTVIKSIASQGIAVDVVYITSSYSKSDAQVVDVTLPDYHVNVGDECVITYSVQSNDFASATVKLYDNGTEVSSQSVSIMSGVQTFTFNHTFQTDGLHELQVEVSSQDDSYEGNNKYYTYLNIEKFNNILILERNSGESDKLSAILTEGAAYNVTVKNVLIDEDIPNSIDELCNYDQVILNNISNEDLSVASNSFVDLLYSYVYDYGGGLFTVGGNDENGQANAYNREDLYGTTLQKMLPVQAINYTPPVGVVIIIDRSGSMGSSFGSGDNTKLEWAKAGARACLDALTERDYFGVITLDSEENWVLGLTACTKNREIRQAIESIGDATGGTVFPGAIEQAGLALRSLTNVAKRHIIIVTDGEVPESQVEQYESLIENFYYQDGITFSVVGIGISEESDAGQKMQEAVNKGNGVFYGITDSDTLIREMREDLNVPAIKEINYEEFNPTVCNVSSTTTTSLMSGIEYEGNQMSCTLDGYYGVKVRDESYLVLSGDYNVPIYAQWKFGNGMVGSFMCDLNGTWSANFVGSADGQQFIKNAVSSLLPVKNIRTPSISYDLKEGNYINTLSVYTSVEGDNYIHGQIYNSDGEVILDLNTSPAEGEQNENCYATTLLSKNNNYSRSTFVLKEGGIYQIVLNLCDAEGNILSTTTVMKEFSYSSEYDITYEYYDADLLESMNTLATSGNGTLIIDVDNASVIFESFVTELARTFNPAMMLTIIAIVLFLLDLIVRKFKFKWIHEIIRERKAKKENEKDNAQ